MSPPIQNLARSLWVVVIAAALFASAARAEPDPKQRIALLEQRTGGRIGLFAKATGSGRTISYRPDERFAMCSTFKWLLAADVLARAAASSGGLALTAEVPLAKRDLLENSPVTTARVAEGKMTVADLVDATLETSDNTAAKLLVPLVGGPASLTDWLRGLGDLTTRVDRNEPEMNTNLPDDPHDTTTPAASGADLERLLLEDALPQVARQQLTTAMEHCQTGRRRLRAGLPAGFRIAHKTGTCARGAVNDVAVVWPPDGTPIVIAAYLSDSDASVERLEAAQAELARLVVNDLAGSR